MSERLLESCQMQSENELRTRQNNSMARGEFQREIAKYYLVTIEGRIRSKEHGFVTLLKNGMRDNSDVNLGLTQNPLECIRVAAQDFFGIYEGCCRKRGRGLC